MKSKRVLALILSLVMLLSVTPFQVLAETAAPEVLLTEAAGSTEPAPEAEALQVEAPLAPVPADSAAEAAVEPVEEAAPAEVAGEAPASTEEVPQDAQENAEAAAQASPEAAAEASPEEAADSSPEEALEAGAEEVALEDAEESLPSPAINEAAEETDVGNDAQKAPDAEVPDADTADQEAPVGMRGDPLDATIVLDKTEVAYEDLIQASWSVTGGTAPYQISTAWLKTYNEAQGWENYQVTWNQGAQGSEQKAAPAGYFGKFVVHVLDAAGVENQFESSVFGITGAPEPYSVIVTTDKNTVAYQESISGSWRITAGKAPFQVDYHWTIIDANGKETWYQQGSSNQASGTVNISQVPAGASGYLSVNVRDADGEYVYGKSAAFEITGSPAPIEVQVTLNKETVAYQETIQAQWVVTGGLAPYEVTSLWEISTADSTMEFNEETVQAASGNASLKVPGGVSGRFVLYITDANGTHFSYATESFQITGSPSPLELTITTDKSTVGFQETITGSWSISGGTAPYLVKLFWMYAYEEHGEWGGNQLAESTQASGTTQWTVPAGKLGKFGVEVTDADGMVTSQTSNTFAITGSPLPLELTAITDKSTVGFQENITGSWTVSGGTPPYQVQTYWQYAYEEHGEWGGNQHAESTQASGTNQWTVSTGKWGMFCVGVTDALGATANKSSEMFAITGSPEPLQATVTTDKRTVNYKEMITGNWVVTGGLAPYQIQPAWLFPDADGETTYRPAQASTQAQGSVSIAAPGRVSGVFSIQIKDAAGLSSWFESESFTIQGSPDPLSAEVTIDKTTVAYRDSITATWSISGGSGPYHAQTRWVIVDENGHEDSLDWHELDGAEGSLTYRVPGGVSGHFRINVFDQDGQHVGVDSENFVITGSPAAPVITLSLDKDSVAYHDAVTASWTIQSAEQPDAVRGYWVIENELGQFSTTGEVTGLPLSGSQTLRAPSGTHGSFILEVELNENQYTRDAGFTITDAPAPAQIQVHLDKDTAAYRDTITASWDIQGGATPFERVETSWFITMPNGDIHLLDKKQHTGTVGSDSLTVPSGVSGYFRVRVVDVDQMETDMETERFAITGNPPPAQVSFNLSTNAVNYLDTITGSWEITEGEVPESVNSYWRITHANDTTQNFRHDWHTGGSGSASFKAIAGVKGRLVVGFYDAGSMEYVQMESDEFTITGSPAPLEATIQLDKTTVLAGEDIVATWSLQSGTPPFTVKPVWRFFQEEPFAFYSMPQQETSDLQGSQTAKATAGNRGTLRLSIEDGSGVTWSFESEEFTINGAQLGMKATIGYTQAQATVGQPVQANYRITGGTAPYEIEYIWFSSDEQGEGEEVATGTVTGATGSYSYTPTSVGRGFLESEIKVTDHNGVVYYAFSSSIPVAPGNPIPEPTATPKDQAVQLSWAAIPGATKYAVSLYEKNAFRVLTDNLTATQYTATGLQNGQVYGFLVQAFVNGAWTSDSQNLLVFATPEKMKLEASLNKETVAFGDPITASWTATGLEDNHHLLYVWILKDSQGTHVLEQRQEEGVPLTGEATLSIQGGVSGEFSIYVLDEEGYTKLSKKLDFAITGSPEDVTGTITLSKQSITAGESLTADWAVTGGVAPYTVQPYWIIELKDGGNYYLEEPTTTDASGSITRTFGNGTSGTLYLHVEDANGISGKSISATFAITGEDAWLPITGKITLDKTTAFAGSPITATYAFSGGKAPLALRYEWYVTDEGDAPEGFEPVKGTLSDLSGTLTFVPTEITIGYHASLDIIAKDADGFERVVSSEFCYIESQTAPAAQATPLEGAVKLDWAPISHATKYAVSVFENGAYRVLNSNLGATATTYTATGLTGGKEYNFLVQAFVNGAWSSDDSSNQVSAVPFTPMVIHLAYAHTTGLPVGFPVKANYAVTGGVPPYQISAKYAIMNNGVRKELETIPVSEASGTLSYTPQEQGILLVNLEAKDSRGTQITSKEAGILIMRVPQPVATPQDAAVHLSWEALPYTTKYAVCIYENGSLRVLSSDILGTSYTATGLQNGQEYSFLVQAFAGGAWTVDNLDLLVKATPMAPLAATVRFDHTGSLAVRFPAMASYEVKGGKAPYQITASYAITKNGVREELETRDLTSAIGSLMYQTTEEGLLHLKVTAKDSLGNQVASNEVSTLVVQVPQPTIKPLDSAAAISWNAYPNATKYAVAIYENGNFTVLSANIQGTSYTATGLTNGKEYRFLLQAFAGGAWTPAHPDLLVSVIPKAMPVPAPFATATPGDGFVELTWPAIPGASAYAVAIREGTGYRLLTSTLKTTNYLATNLMNGREYAFLVQANINGRWSSSDTSNLVYATPVAQPVPAPMPEAVAGDGQVELHWEAILGAQKYAVAIKEGAGYRLLSASVTGTQYTATGLTNGRDYQFLVQANVNGRWSDNGEELLVAATPYAKPIPAPNAQTIPLDGAVRLYWGAVQGAGAYAVAIKDGASLRLLTASVTGLTYTATGLTNGREYQFLVQANVNGRWSSDDAFYLVSETPFATPIPVPAVQVVGISNGVNLS